MLAALTEARDLCTRIALQARLADPATTPEARALIAWRLQAIALRRAEAAGLIVIERFAEAA